jgi:hypothetical protein
MNPLQRASRNRKIIYFVVIAVLFTVSMVWRGLIPVPLGASQARVAQPFRWAEAHTIQSQAQRLEVWESDPNETEADISGTAASLALTGSRGFVVTALWLSAIDKQKRNDFHEFEQRVAMVTKLQPNFITPWIFQSWNIAYNVSVEMQGSGDMYYYIVKGIQLLAEGERRNKRSPDMRYWIAFTYQNKFGVSDQVETLRCLFDLSCIPPAQRQPNKFIDPLTHEINLDEFRKFCAQHPHFVRRLRGEVGIPQTKQAKEKLSAATPKEVVEFLRVNYEVPSRYKGDDLKDPQDPTQFPVLPPQFDTGSEELAEAHPGIVAAEDAAPGFGYFSAYKAARAWFSYSLVLLPPPIKDDQGQPLPGPTPPPGVAGHDPAKHRVPRAPMMILFRQGAPRAQSYQAEMEQKEGWFDAEGWQIDDPASAPDKWWFPVLHLPPEALTELRQAGVSEAAVQKLDRSPLKGATLSRASWDTELAKVLSTEEVQQFRDAIVRTLIPRPLGVVVGTDRPWSLVEWQRAARMWDEHGKAYGLSLTEVQLTNLRRLAGESTALANPSPEQLADENVRRRFVANAALQYYASQRGLTNFPYFLASAEAEARVIGGVPATVLARKTLWKAEQARKQGENPLAIRLYKDGLEQWKRVLTENPNFHRLPPPDHSDRVEEETAEYELTYLQLIERADERVTARANQFAHAAHAVVPFLTEPFPKDATVNPQWHNNTRENLKWYVVENVAGADFSSPFVGSMTPRGEPWITDPIKEMVRHRHGIGHRQQVPGGPPQPGMPGMPPGGPPGRPPGGPPGGRPGG